MALFPVKVRSFYVQVLQKFRIGWPFTVRLLILQRLWSLLLLFLKKILGDSGPLSICACAVLAGFTNHLFWAEGDQKLSLSVYLVYFSAFVFSKWVLKQGSIMFLCLMPTVFTEGGMCFLGLCWQHWQPLNISIK